MPHVVSGTALPTPLASHRAGFGRRSVVDGLLPSPRDAPIHSLLEIAIVFSNIESLLLLNKTLHNQMLEVGIVAAFQDCGMRGLQTC